MKDTERLARSGYRIFPPKPSIWFKDTRDELLYIQRKHRNRVLLSCSMEKPSVEYPTVEQAITAGEAFLAERTAERKADRPAPD